MKKYINIILFLFIFTVLTGQENSNVQKNILSGNIKKTPVSWIINLKYKDKDITGEFKEISNVNINAANFAILLNIFDDNYNGTINYSKLATNGKIYNIELLNNKNIFKGSISTSYDDAYRKDIFGLVDGQKNISGNIMYSRKNYDENINLKLGDESVAGSILNKSVYLQNYSLKFDDKQISGIINNKRPYYNFSFIADELNEEEILIFLYVEIHHLIDEFNMDNEQSEKFKEDNPVPDLRDFRDQFDQDVD
jgi:hypothetical protein